MNFFETLYADLRERQIFPAVVLLAVLALGIPLLAPRFVGSVKAPPPPAPTPALPAPPSGVQPPQQVLASLQTVPAPSSLTRRGAEADPFREKGPMAAGGGNPVTPATNSSSKTTTSTTTSTTPAKTTPAKTTPAKTTPAKTTPAKTTPAKTTPAKTTTTKTTTTKTSTTSAPTKPKSGGSGTTTTPAVVNPTTGPATLKPTQAYTINIDTKDATGTHVLSDVVRLAPLPDAQTPEIILLGVVQGGKKVAFLFTNSVKVSGQSGSGLTCLPTPSDCQIVELAPGQGMRLAPTANAALISTFTFELVSIGVADFSSADKASAERSAVSAAGQTLIPLSSSTALATLSFSDKLGALVHQSAPSGSTAATGSTGSTSATSTTGSTGTTGAS
jgi:hypothetical protein